MPALPWWQLVRSAALDLIFPPRCAGCGRTGEWFCANCVASLQLIRPPLCARCGQATDDTAPCTSCRMHPLPDALTGLRAVARYQGGLRQAIHALKYEQIAVLAEPLGTLLADYLKVQALAVNLIVPVPLHPAREEERGYNQSALLAKVISQRASIPLDTRIIVRGRDTPPQVGLGESERRANMVGAFRCLGRLDGAQVLIVDDVCTTGATLSECAVALKAAGAVTIWGLTLAR